MPVSRGIARDFSCRGAAISHPRGLTGMDLPLYSAGFAPPAPWGLCRKAPVAELVDALDSKSSSARSAGSIPARGTKLRSYGSASQAPLFHLRRRSPPSDEGGWRGRATRTLARQCGLVTFSHRTTYSASIPLDGSTARDVRVRVFSLIS